MKNGTQYVGMAMIVGAFCGAALGIRSAYLNAQMHIQTTPDVTATSAINLLREKKPEPLSGPLHELLRNAKDHYVKTQQHTLLGKPAPSFTLQSVEDGSISLDEILKKGPVIVVFYLGYSCDHCVNQLFGLEEDLDYFHELGATVIAISEDSIAKTQDKYWKYGAFSFPVLSDPTHEIAQRYGVYAPANNGRRAWEAHGTFVIGQDKSIRWAETGAEPFTHNPTLLIELAKLAGRLSEN